MACVGSAAAYDEVMTGLVYEDPVYGEAAIPLSCWPTGSKRLNDACREKSLSLI